eukprot:gnl/MRDRNA2_/MRDRNA2_86242_c0_seq1.p1 gnl/MRDRNA2_/MRDRNA2_86242_c0~~gnl/MRDRNA2_/MRDRNA2_86242_c0_seq1.p1  ORF type:complete len:452 (-),score=28.51 gnl/MRDRNA2_/MRDRNA2_86242_c0_seq1:57-1412(-)
MIAAAQQQEIGDGTNLVIILAAELLGHAEILIRDGLHPLDIAEGYGVAFEHTLKLLDSLVIPGSKHFNHLDESEVSKNIKGVVSSKLFETFSFDRLIARACIYVCPQNPKHFDPNDVRVCKLMGGKLEDSTAIRGILFTRNTEGSVKKVRNAKTVVYCQGISTSAPETKSTGLFRSPDEMWNYNLDEENRLKDFVQDLVNTGVKVVVCGSPIQELSHHFLDNNQIMIIQLNSKFEMHRFCQATGSRAIVKLRPPTIEELGFAKKIELCEFGSSQCIVLTQDPSMCRVSSILIRGSTQQSLDDAERAIDDGVNAYRILCKDARTLPAGAATELAISRHLFEIAQGESSLKYYAIEKFAEALYVVPRTLAENSGLDSTHMLSLLRSAHLADIKNAGLDLLRGQVKNLAQDDIVDLYLSKWWCFKLLSEAVLTVLKIDHIVIAKQACKSVHKTV